MTKDFLELSELLAQIREDVTDAFPDRDWVKGEISSWSPRANGHCYLNLSESVRGKQVADIRAMSWRACAVSTCASKRGALWRFSAITDRASPPR